MRSTACGLALVVGLAPSLPAQQVAQPVQAGAAAPAPMTGTSGLSGKIVGADGQPVPGATVLAYHLSTEEVYRSNPTDDKGAFSFDKLPYGYFDVAVLGPSGLFVADAVVNVPPSGKATVSLALVSGAPEATLRTFPGTDQQPVGIATMARSSDKSFWSSAGGIAVLVGGGAVALAALASGGGGDSTSSPSTP